MGGDVGGSDARAKESDSSSSMNKPKRIRQEEKTKRGGEVVKALLLRGRAQGKEKKKPGAGKGSRNGS